MSQGTIRLPLELSSATGATTTAGTSTATSKHRVRIVAVGLNCYGKPFGFSFQLLHKLFPLLSLPGWLVSTRRNVEVKGIPHSNIILALSFSGVHSVRFHTQSSWA